MELLKALWATEREGGHLNRGFRAGEMDRTADD
jgi:hypothetical protein